MQVGSEVVVIEAGNRHSLRDRDACPVQGRQGPRSQIVVAADHCSHRRAALQDLLHSLETLGKPVIGFHQRVGLQGQTATCDGLQQTAKTQTRTFIVKSTPANETDLTVPLISQVIDDECRRRTFIKANTDALVTLLGPHHHERNVV